MALLLEGYIPVVQEGGLNTLKNTSLGGTLAVTGATTLSSTLAVTGASTFTGVATFNGGTVISGGTIRKYTPQAVNSSATLTAANLQGGYITTTSVAGVTMTMPSGTSLGGSLGAVQGTVLDFYIDNTAGANPVTVAVGTNAVQSDWDNQLTAATASVTPAAVTPLTVTSGVSGIARYTIVFSSATAYTFSRSA